MPVKQKNTVNIVEPGAPGIPEAKKNTVIFSSGSFQVGELRQKYNGKTLQKNQALGRPANKFTVKKKKGYNNPSSENDK